MSISRRRNSGISTDNDRYRFGFLVNSASSNSRYKISFDTAIMAWKCSCRGCISHQKTCKHLRACGLTGPECRGQDLPSPQVVEEAKRLGSY